MGGYISFKKRKFSIVELDKWLGLRLKISNVEENGIGVFPSVTNDCE